MFVICLETVCFPEQLHDGSMQTVDENATPPFPETFDRMAVPMSEGSTPNNVAAQVTGVPVLKDGWAYDLPGKDGTELLCVLTELD